jgi:hypothetical protein
MAALVAMLVVVAGGALGASAASAGVLDVTLAGPGTGAVTSDPAGIDCSNVPGSSQTACSHDYGFLFATGTLTATPGEGSAFLSWSGVGAGTCSSGAANPCTTGTLFQNQSVTATFAPTPDAPEVATGSASDIDLPSAKLAGTVNPNSASFATSDCYFEYGLTTDYGRRADCQPATVGPGVDVEDVSATTARLQPNSTYHYRLVAENGGGTTHGADQTFHSDVAPHDPCPNADVRAEQGLAAQVLPMCFAYELATPNWTSGQRALRGAMNPEGDSLLFSSAGGFAGSENLTNFNNLYFARRTESGWVTEPLTPPGSVYPYLDGQGGVRDHTDDGSRALWMGNALADVGTNRYTPFIRESDGTMRVAGPVIDDGTGSSTIVGTSADLNTVVFRTKARPALTDGTVDARPVSRESLMVAVRQPDGSIETRQVAFSGGATMFPTCTLYLGGYLGTTGVTGLHAVSADGQRIFFTPSLALPACNSAAVNRVWMKDGTNDPVDLSATQCTTDCGVQQRAAFSGASRDGNRVYFKTEQKLVDGDQDTASKMDLYEYDFERPGNKLVPVTIGTDAAGAGVLNVVRVSDDGSRVYFVANGRALAGANVYGNTPQAGQPNLYVYHRPALDPAGTIKFVGTLAAADADLWAGDVRRKIQLSDSGRYAFFLSTADLAGDRLPGDAFNDVFRFDAQSGGLRRLWPDDPDHNGAARSGGISPDFGTMTAANGSGSLQTASNRNGKARQFSNGGASFIFQTAERLSPDDVNTAEDVYLWRAGDNEFFLLSSGQSIQDAGAVTMSPSGDAIAITTAAPLLPEHTSGSVATYVLRSGGGFLEPAKPAPPCAGDGCQGAPTAPPAPPSVGSVGFGGDGNVADPGRASVGVLRLKAVTGSAGRVKVRVPGAGRISLAGPSVRRTGRSASRAGSYTVRVALSFRARKALRKRKALKVRVRIAFKAKDGQSASKTVRVTFKRPQKKQNKAKKGGR